MTLMTAVVRNGRSELPAPLDLPDGTELLVEVPEPEGPPSPEEIARTLAAMEAAEPLEMTEADWTAWQEDRAARKHRDLAEFHDYSESLRKMWE